MRRPTRAGTLTCRTLYLHLLQPQRHVRVLLRRHVVDAGPHALHLSQAERILIVSKLAARVCKKRARRAAVAKGDGNAASGVRTVTDENARRTVYSVAPSSMCSYSSWVNNMIYSIPYDTRIVFDTRYSIPALQVSFVALS